ncbi:MAG: hypothetical protein M3P96_10635, partial [Actinomycetota bacterium]|nr:hypothetical protein [Actinomycetota bacterium]
MGLCKSSLMLGIYAAATNLRLLDTWAANTGLSEPPALAQVAHRPAPLPGDPTQSARVRPGDDPPDH